MSEITTFPIRTKNLSPVEYPEFKGEPGPATEWQATATHLQSRPVGGGAEDWADVVALSEITGPEGDPVLTPIAEYTETGATLAFVAESSGDIAIDGDGTVSALTITGDCSLVTGTWPTAPECANVAVSILIDRADPEVEPVIALDATWNWADKTVVPIPTEDGARCILQLASYPHGWIEASVREIGVPS